MGAQICSEARAVIFYEICHKDAGQIHVRLPELLNKLRSKYAAPHLPWLRFAQ